MTGPLETAWSRFKRKAWVIKTMEEMQDRTASGFDMHRVLGALDLVLLGIGCTIGAGIMVLTGVAARKYAGPGVVLSYGMSAVAAMLTSFCYAEFAADLPVAGGAFNYIGMTFGEFAAWVAACDLILEYTLSAAAVAKGFTAYFASLLGFDVHKIRVQAGIISLDFLAFASVVLMSLVLARSTRESSLLNSIVVGLHMALIVFVLCAGFPNVQAENYAPFLPFGMRGAFTGASVVFFSFIGFDTVATAAEEVKNPGRDLPIGIVGSLSICTVLYVLMCLVITGMVYYSDIDLNAPFSVAFRSVGLGWAEKIVAAGALAGIVTSLFGSLLGQARIYVTLGRQYLLPAWLARVDPSTGTPRNATLVTMFTAGSLALLFDIELLAELVSIGTLVVFAMVCTGVLFRRYYVRGSGEPMQPLLQRLVAIVLCSIGFSLSYIEHAHFMVPVVFILLWAAATASFHWLPVRYTPTRFRCPLQPWLPSMGTLACLHLIGSLGWPAYVRWIVWFTLGSCVYFYYGMYHTQGEGNSRLAATSGIAMTMLPTTSIRQPENDLEQHGSIDSVAGTVGAWLLDGQTDSTRGPGQQGRSGARQMVNGDKGKVSDDGTSPPTGSEGGSSPPAHAALAHEAAAGGSLGGEQAHRRHISFSSTASSAATAPLERPAAAAAPAATAGQVRYGTPQPRDRPPAGMRHNPKSFG